MASRRNGSNSSRNSEATVQNGTRNGYGHSYLQKTTGPNGKTVNGRGPANKSQREFYDGSNNMNYGYGGPFRPDNDTDRSSEISERSDDFLGNYKHQQWMDKITGDTFKRNYLDRISFRPTLAHDPSIPLQDTRDFRHDDNHNISQHAQDPSGYKKEKNRNTLKKVLIAILVLLLLGGISGVLAWYFTIKGDEDTSINYYVVTSEMALSNDYNPELSDSSSQEFKNLSTQFCDAITEALRKNNTEYGDRYKHCEVTAFKNGSIIVFYKLFYVFLEVQITKEKVQKDLNKSLTNVDPERAKLSDFVIIRASVKFTVEVQTFQTDPIVPSAQLITSTTEILPTTEETTTSEAVTTTAAKSTEAMITTEVKTTGESTTATTETTSSTTKEATSTMAVATTTVEATTTPPPSPTTSEATSTTAEATTTTAESTTTTAPPPLTTTTTAEVTTTTESTTLTTTTTLTPTTTTTTAEGTSTTAGATTTIESTTTTAPPPLTTTTTSITAESTTPTTTPPLTTTTTTTAEATTTEAPSTTTSAATSILESISTTADATTTTAESTTLTTTPLLTTTTAESTTLTIPPPLTTTTTTTTAKATTTEASSTTTLAATSTLEAISTIADATTTTARESTTLTTTPPLTTIPSETTTTEATTTLSATSTLETISTTSYATSTTAESTTPPTTTSTTEAPSTLFTTERSTRITSVASSESLKTSTTIGTSESSPKQTTVDTTESSTSTTMGSSILTTKGTTETSTSLTTQSSTISTIGTTEVSGSTTMVTPTTSEQYTADVVVSPMIAIYGETTTTKTCVVSPRGNWVHITVTVENQGISYPIRKYHSNKTFEEPASLERFNASISSTDTEIVVYLSLDLQAPTTDMCSWDGKYTFSCSITMNDTIHTRVYNGSQIFLTAPISDVTIDSNVHYNEGDKMTFNCSSKGDPNHSMVYTELVKASTVLQTIPGPDFSSGYNYTSDNNCLADLQWSGDSPNPLTTYQNDVIVRCTVKNTLLNESRTSEKRLNVSVFEYESSIMSTTIGTTESSTMSTTMVTTTASEQYTADVVVSPMIAIYGETTTTKTCVISPRGNWVHVTVTVENQGISYPIRKYHSNKTFEEPTSLERFNASISSTDTEIVVYLSLDLQAPSTDMCSWDGIFTFSCSITMNDTISTRLYNGSQIFLTAPISDVTIDSNVHYIEGDKMTFNCSSKGDPNHSMVYTELVKASTVLETIPGPDFSSGYNYTSDNNCLADLQWSGDSPNPLTTDQNDVIVRCTVKNTLLNESRTSEKRLNVSVVEYESSTISMSTTERSTTSTTMETTESSTTSTTMDTTESSTTTTPVLKYSADVAVYPVIAIFGETATTEVCALTPHGDWLYATLTVEYQNMQYVVGKFLSNSSLEEPDSLERFNISMSNKNMDIVVHLTLNLQTPTTDTCSMDGKYTFTCSITMNDTMQTLQSNGSQIFMTAPMSEISIDSEVNYNEGEKMTFNCSMKGDPNYSTAYVEMIKNSQILHKIQGPLFGSDYISNCTAVLNWSGGPPTPLTSQEHDLIVRCVVKNNLLNETRKSEKKLNVSAADVAFQKYSYQALTSSREEIECIARSPMSILQELIISKDDVQIATLNSSGVASSTNGRYSTNIQEYDGEVRLKLSILSVDCQDQGRYNCKLITTNNATRVSPNMSFIVEGSKPTMTLHPDIYEPFARRDLNHVCSTDHIGDENNDNFLEIQIFQPGSQRAFTYSKKIAEVEKMFDSTNNITYINITGTTAQFLLVSHTSSSSNQSCNIKETITFLLDLKMDFDNGTIKCVLKDEMEEFSAVESRITVIPGNFCDGYENRAFRKHPNNDCNDYIECTEYQGKMYATGNQCPSIGQCIQFTTRSCVPCDSTFACDELTTPGPTTTTTTLPPGRRYVSCNDSAHFLGTTALIRCVILDTSFNSLNITFLPEQSQNEEYVGEIFPDGQTQSLPQSPVVLSTNFDLSPKILMFTFQLLECSSRGRYRIIAGGTNSSVAPSVETFELNVLGNLTEFEMHIEPAYSEGTLVEFNCTASLDESHANIKGYYKKESESSFSEIEGSTSVIERNLSHCFVKALWKPSTPFTADTSFNNADLKCELVDWPLVQRTKKISVQNADVAFETYKLESSIGSQVSVKCFARNTNSIKSVLIRKIENSLNITVANVTLPDMTSHVDGTTVSYSNNSLALTFTSLTCSDDGQYTCIVITEDESQIESPAYLRVQIKNPPKHEAVAFILNPDIKENKYDTNNVHTCSGDVGYPSGLGYLSLKFTDPTTNASFTYDKMTVTEDMKIALDSPLKFKLSLSSGLSIIIVEDDEPDIVNCTRKKEIKFLLQATRDWNKAKIRCRVVSETNEVNFTSVEKDMYVIPDAVCDGSNGSDIYVPHEKIDQCRTYIRCFNYKPTGQICGPQLCFDHQKKYCDWCTAVACESEMSPTTEEQITTTYSTPVVPEIQCPLLSCNPTSVFEMETGNIVCVLNTSMSYDNITVMKNDQAIMTIYPNGTNYYYLDNIEKYESTVGTSFTFGIKNVSCSDKDEYTFTVDVGDGGRCSKAASLDIKSNLTEFEMHIEPAYREVTLVEFNCTASLDESHANIKGYYKKESESSFSEIEGSTSVIERNLSHCFVKVLWKPSTPFTADTSFHNADLKCELVDWPLVQRTKKISVQNADVAFETYKLESSIGSQVSVKCFARNTNSIKSVLIQKIENPLSTTVANVTLPDMTYHNDGITVSYSNNSLTLTFTSLTCSDDGQYTCIVIKEDESQIESPAYLRVQIKNPPKHEQVVFILNPDIKENIYDTSNVHTCSGDVGYPSGLGYLSLKFTDPTTNASFTYDKMTVTEDMKIALDLPLKFKVSLSSGLSIIIVEDDEPAIINCTRKKEIKFLLQATRDWNKAKIRCRVISETNEVNSTSHEKEIYVIPDAVCDGSNGSDIYVPHEKIDECRTYIRCFNNKPTGQLCQTADLCFDHQKNYCDWCRVVACESEMSSTTESQMTTTSSLPAVPEIQCPLLSCKPSSVFEMETGDMVCELNTSMTYENITVMKNGQAIMTVYPNGTNHYFSDETEKYDSTVGTSFTFFIKNVSCSDENEYTFTVEVGEGGSCYKTASLEMKAKPGIPTLAIDYRWTEGTNLGIHSCTGSIGNPPGTMTLEIRDGETGNFTSFSPSTKSLNTIKENCHYDATLTFSINFNTEKIRSHYIRCVANNQHTLLISEPPFYSKEVFVNPLPANACFENGLHPYPGDCTRFLNCHGNITSVTLCPSGLCYKLATEACDNDCTRCST
nr:uncharacterized protein LOC105324798 isoform X7 [Crassostrea gigas]